jgi:DNA-binding NarL/FixJ family response regulator
MGFVPKRASPQTLFQALRLVMSGGIFVPPMSLGADANRDHGDGDTTPSVMQGVGAEAAVGAHQRAPTLESLGLTPRQRDVLALLLQGKPNKLIAREMGLSVETVKDHVAAVLRALGVTSRTQAVLAVSQMGQPEGFQAWKPSR